MKKRYALPILAASTLLTAAVTIPAMADEVAPGTLGVVATFSTATEATWKATLSDPESISAAYASLNGTAEWPTHPLGTIVYGDAAENVGWSWHLADTSMVEISTEVCDGHPDDVEAHHITSPYFCPWNAKVIAIDPA